MLYIFVIPIVSVALKIPKQRRNAMRINAIGTLR